MFLDHEQGLVYFSSEAQAWIDYLNTRVGGAFVGFGLAALALSPPMAGAVGLSVFYAGVHHVSDRFPASLQLIRARFSDSFSKKYLQAVETQYFGPTSYKKVWLFFIGASLLMANIMRCAMWWPY